MDGPGTNQSVSLSLATGHNHDSPCPRDTKCHDRTVTAAKVLQSLQQLDFQSKQVDEKLATA